MQFTKWISCILIVATLFIFAGCEQTEEPMVPSEPNSAVPGTPPADIPATTPTPTPDTNTAE